MKLVFSYFFWIFFECFLMANVLQSECVDLASTSIVFLESDTADTASSRSNFGVQKSIFVRKFLEFESNWKWLKIHV